MLVGRRGELAAQLASEIGETALGVGADIADPEQVAAAISAALDRFGTIDININTAGIQGFVPLVGPTAPRLTWPSSPGCGPSTSWAPST